MAFDCMYPHDTKHQYVVSSGGSRPDGEEVGRRSGLAKSFALFRGRKSDQKGTLEKDHPRLSEAVGTATRTKCRQSMLWLLQIRGVERAMLCSTASLVCAKHGSWTHLVSSTGRPRYNRIPGSIALTSNTASYQTPLHGLLMRVMSI
jgi:hypothetical protein